MPKFKSSSATPAATPPVAPAAVSAPAVSSPVLTAPATPPQPAPLVTGAGTSTSSTGSVHSTKVDVQAQFQAVVAGLLAYYQPTDTFMMSDGTYTRDELIALFQGFVSSCEGTKSAYQTWRTYVGQEQQLLAQVRPMRSGVRGIVQARFTKQGPQVLVFGFTPNKGPARSAASKAAAAVKAAATRKARGTVGKKKKATITGATTPAAAPPAPAGAPSPTVTPAPASPVVAPSPVAPAAPAPVTAAPAAATQVAPAPAAAPAAPAAAAPPPPAPPAPSH